MKKKYGELFPCVVCHKLPKVRSSATDSTLTEIYCNHCGIAVQNKDSYFTIIEAYQYCRDIWNYLMNRKP